MFVSNYKYEALLDYWTQPNPYSLRIGLFFIDQFIEVPISIGGR